ncbi:spore germination protein [Shimazuella sp. AN120528]|uniref:spore germination protein n=1 Tax=Shimazuella soli TaxID=1892854 RepID=UPI001F10773C|nr:spore germination protein [Shimazuella soli]MCH5584445.1 spore germination protein [Shimazuella soli]
MKTKSFTKTKRSQMTKAKKTNTGEILVLKTELQDNIQQITKSLGNSPDIIVRKWIFGKDDVAIIYTSGLADAKLVNQFIMEPLMSLNENNPSQTMPSENKDLLDGIKKLLLPIGGIRETESFDTLLTAILSGDTVLLCQGYDRCLLLTSKGWEQRAIEEPTTHTVIRGPKEGFTENIATNISLVRRKIKDPNLWLENFQVGCVTKTSVSIMYINGIVKEEVVKEVRERISRIEIDGILESGYIEELIQDKTFTLFPTIYNTERPDVIAAGILEGRIAILIDGTPFVLMVPAIITQFFQTAEDYYQRADISTLLRILRFIALFISLLGPALYIAITTFHQDMLPPQLLISLSSQREGIPFPAFIEALLMEFTFELLREAGTRLPRTVGQAISIVGALVIGQAAIQAGIVSPAMVIVVSITAIASFTVPSYNMAIAFRILRFGMMILAASFGLFGVMAGFIWLIQHLCHLRSFAVPYLSPFAPNIPKDKKDILVRVPWWKMTTRPKILSEENVIRENSSPVSEEEPEESG